MPSYVTKSGEIIEWTGLGMCFCTECEVLFNSETAFDAHLVSAVMEKEGRKRINFSQAKHDYSKMPKNSRGAYVTALMPTNIVYGAK